MENIGFPSSKTWASKHLSEANKAAVRNIPRVTLFIKSCGNRGTEIRLNNLGRLENVNKTFENRMGKAIIVGWVNKMIACQESSKVAW